MSFCCHSNRCMLILGVKCLVVIWLISCKGLIMFKSYYMFWSYLSLHWSHLVNFWSVFFFAIDLTNHSLSCLLELRIVQSQAPINHTFLLELCATQSLRPRTSHCAILVHSPCLLHLFTAQYLPRLASIAHCKLSVSSHPLSQSLTCSIVQSIVSVLPKLRTT